MPKKRSSLDHLRELVAAQREIPAAMAACRADGVTFATLQEVTGLSRQTIVTRLKEHAMTEITECDDTSMSVEEIDPTIDWAAVSDEHRDAFGAAVQQAMRPLVTEEWARRGYTVINWRQQANLTTDRDDADMRALQVTVWGVAYDQLDTMTILDQVLSASSK